MKISISLMPQPKFNYEWTWKPSGWDTKHAPYKKRYYNFFLPIKTTHTDTVELEWVYSMRVGISMKSKCKASVFRNNQFAIEWRLYLDKTCCYWGCKNTYNVIHWKSEAFRFTVRVRLKSEEFSASVWDARKYCLTS